MGRYIDYSWSSLVLPQKLLQIQEGIRESATSTAGEERPWVVYKEGNEAIGGGDLVSAWLSQFLVINDLCLCNLVGVEASGRPRIINGQGWHHPGKLYANDEVYYLFSRCFGCNCRCSKIKIHYPSTVRNKHTMNGHIATKLARAVVDVFKGMPRDDPRNVPRTLNHRQDVRRKAYLSKEEGYEKMRERSRLAFAEFHVERFLRKREERRSQQRPPPKRITWENRPKWNGVIADLT